ncbi:hypothetical protein [Microbacterium sp. USTB-Y]|uniref:hypothetical protein n=1 Tax=Microbacterium sp. USTB-Y TaxID=2823692 RepID=UPI00203BB912|nr:hypothetical protein [Microbacterium sp. USTB-Y]
MSRRIELPTRQQVEATVRELSATGSAPVLTAKELARHLGLTNGTFWRHFPDIAQSVADGRRRLLRDETKPALPPTPQKVVPERQLRLQIEELKRQISVAAAQIQRLTLENEALRRQLEAENTIIRIRDQ